LTAFEENLENPYIYKIPVMYKQMEFLLTYV